MKEDVKHCEELIKTFKNLPKSEKIKVLSYAMGVMAGYEVKKKAS